MPFVRRVDGVGRLDDSMYTPPEWSVVALLPDFGRVLLEFAELWHPPACHLWWSSRVWGKKRPKESELVVQTLVGERERPGPR